jgi:hypothetical protein
MIRKEVMIVLITFCLTATLFSIIPVGSLGVREYNPWYDINDDGKIDLKDYYGVGLKYATTGDSTKNVTIAGRASKLITLANGEPIPAISWFTSDPISVDGYSKISISIGFTEPEFDYYLWTGHDPSNTLFVADQGDETTLGKINCKTYDVMNTYIKIRVRNPGAYEGYLNLDVYLIP